MSLRLLNASAKKRGDKIRKSPEVAPAMSPHLRPAKRTIANTRMTAKRMATTLWAKMGVTRPSEVQSTRHEIAESIDANGQT